MRSTYGLSARMFAAALPATRPSSAFVGHQPLIEPVLLCFDARYSGTRPQPTQEIVMKIQEAMTSNVRIANPNQSICEAARMMAECDAGSIPVGENDQLVGVI